MNLKKLFGRKRYEKYQEERDKAELLRRDEIIREGKNLEFWKVLKEEVEEEILKAIELLIYPNLMQEYGLENDLNEVQYLRGMINALDILTQEPEIILDKAEFLRKIQERAL